MAHLIYAAELTASLRYGYPIWEPDCDPEVCIADVGYIRLGQFCRLFNASLPPGHPANQEFGEPEGYEPLEIGAIQERTPHPPGVMMSASVSKQGADIGVSTSLLQAGGGFNFACARDRGAALIINSEAYRKDALRTSAFKQYLIKHYKSWVQLANNEHNARDISESDLVFVTGRDNTADWAMAAFTQRSLSGGISFEPGFLAGNNQFSIWGSWAQTSGLLTHCGPRIPRANHNSAISELIATGSAPMGVCAADLDKYNQCIFLRGFRIMEKATYAKRKILKKITNSTGGLDEVTTPWFTRSPSSGSISDSSNGGHSSSDGSSLGKQSTQFSSFASMDSPEINDSTARLFQTPVPLNAVLQYIHANADVDIAVAHDHDLTEMLKAQDCQEMVDFDKVVGVSAPPIYVDSQGVGTVKPSDSSPVSVIHPPPLKDRILESKPLYHSPDASGQTTPTVGPPETPRTREIDLISEKLGLKGASLNVEPVRRSRNRLTSPSSTPPIRTRKATRSPSSAAYHEEKERIGANIDELQARLAMVQDRISLTTKTGRGADRRNALRVELDSLRDKQLKQRMERDAASANLRTMQEEIRKKVQEHQHLNKKLPARTIEGVDAQIKTLEDKVETGTMRLQEEKAALRQISALRRSRTAVENSQSLQTEIDAHRARADALRKDLDSGSQTVTLRMNAVREELETLRKESEAAFAERAGLYEERSQLQTQLSELYDRRRQVTETFRTEREEARRKSDEERARAAAIIRAERAALEQRQRIEAQERLLEKARAPAYAAEIRDCLSLIEYFSGMNKGDRSIASTTSTTPASAAVDTGHQLRQPVENYPESSAGWVPMKKKNAEDSYFVGSKGKMKKGTRKGASMTPGSAKVSVPLGILSTLVSMSIEPPAVVSEVRKTMEELRGKMEWYEANQANVTEANVARAKAELQRITNPVRYDEPPIMTSLLGLVV